MARIPGVEEEGAGLLTRVAYWYVKRQFGRVLEPLKLYAHHPPLLRVYGRMEMGLKKLHAVPEKLKSLAGVRAAILVDCPF